MTAAYLYHPPAFAREAGGILSCRAAYRFIVDAYRCRVIVTVDVAVKDYDRHARLIHLFYYRRDGLGFVRRSDYDIKTVVLEITDVGNLLFVAVIGRTYLHLGLGMKHNFTIYLIVHLIAPVITAALRHSYAIMLLLTTTTECEHKRQ